MTIGANRSRTLGTVLGVALGVLGLSTVSEAQVVYIDLGDAAGSEGGNWNTVSSGVPVDLVDWNTGLSVGWDPFVAGGEDHVFPGWDTSTPGNWAGDASAGDAFTLPNDFNIIITEVDSTLSYTIDILSYANGAPSTQPADIQINGNFADSDAKGLGLNGDDYDPLTANGNWLTYNNVVPEGGVGPGQPGQITFSFEEFGTPFTQMAVSAIRITAVPEPSTAMLLGLGIAGVFRKRRRANK